MVCILDAVRFCVNMMLKTKFVVVLSYFSLEVALKLKAVWPWFLLLIFYAVGRVLITSLSVVILSLDINILQMLHFLNP